MNPLRNFMNWLKTLSASYRIILRDHAHRTFNDLRRVHHTIIAEARKFDRAFQQELRLKAALSEINARLAGLAAQAETTESAGKPIIARLQSRQQTYERAVNLVRIRINTARHGWAKLEKDAKSTFATMRGNLVGARPQWAKFLCTAGEKLLHNLMLERRRVARLMTTSALLYDGRTLSSALANRPRSSNAA